MSKNNFSSIRRVPIKMSLRHLIVFQFKLLTDAMRDLMFSPLSIAAFIADAFLRPSAEKSLTFRLMSAGRYSDRVINLFNEYSKTGNYTLDDSVSNFETILNKKIEERRENRS